MLRRLSPIQPDSFEFTPANLDWVQAWISKYPEGRQQSAIIPVLWRAQEQEGWLSRPAIERCADLLGMPYIRALEVATFYFMFQLQPVGSIANIQICGTTTCMICGAEELIAVCREKIAPTPHTVSADGKFSWEEVECLGACSNAPMAQIGKDYYEDLTAEKLSDLIDALSDGRVPVPGPQNGRFSSEPLGGRTSLTGTEPVNDQNASVSLALEIGDTVKRITGDEVPILTKWKRKPDAARDDQEGEAETPKTEPTPAEGKPADDTGSTVQQATAQSSAKPDTPSDDTIRDGETAGDLSQNASGEALGTAPPVLDQPRAGGADDLKRIDGVGPKLEGVLNDLGFYHFDQIAAWSEAEIAWVDAHLDGFKGRVERDEWVKQAQALAGNRSDDG